MIIEVKSVTEMQEFGQRLAHVLHGGEIIELVGDMGAGKTTLTKGIAKGLGIDDDIQSPSFTINRIYSVNDEVTLAHYDFYRLNDAGIMQQELSEAISDPHTIVIIEWADIVKDVLPTDRLTLHITATSENSRRIVMDAIGEASRLIVKQL